MPRAKMIQWILKTHAVIYMHPHAIDFDAMNDYQIEQIVSMYKRMHKEYITKLRCYVEQSKFDYEVWSKQ